MPIDKPFTGCAPLAHILQTKPLIARPWQLRWKPVCASTEIDLSEWLKEKPLKGNLPRAFLADRQTHGIGQRGRIWQSSEGGVWISAAFPIVGSNKSAGLLGLAVAVALVHKLAQYSVPVQIKWPNDLMIGDRKLAGLLPRLVFRGKTLRLGRVGLGLNVRNQVPVEGISLADFLRPNHCHPVLWAAEVIETFETAIELIGEAQAVCLEAERLLWAKEVKDPQSGELLQIEGLDLDGSLKLRKGTYKVVWNRWARI